MDSTFYTGKRAERIEELDLLVEVKAISKAEKRRIMRDENLYELQLRANRKAKQARERREAERKKKEEEEAKKRAEALALWLAQQREKEKERKAKKAQKARERRAKIKAEKEAQRERMVAYTLSATVRHKRDDVAFGTPAYPWFTVSRQASEKVKGDVDKHVADKLGEYIAYLTTESKLELQRGSGRSVITSNTPVAPEKVDKKTIKMKSASALDLDGHQIQTWDSGKGTCVYDFLIWRYGELKGCKKVATYERLDELFSSRAESPFSSPREEGVNVYQLEAFCDEVGVRMYALDEDDTVIHSYAPVKINKALPPLIFRITNAHFYAVMDRSMSISRIGKRESDMCYKTKEERELSEKSYKIEILEPSETETPTKQMIRIMKEQKKQVYPFRNIQFDTHGLRSFIIDETKYMFNEEDSVVNAKRIAELNGWAYKGETTFSILINLMQELGYTDKSICNPQVYDSLTAENVKFRTHYGTDGDYTYDSLNTMVQNGEAICADIAKCYTACIEKPEDQFMLFGFNDVWADYDQVDASVLKTGLYYVETDDMTLLHGTNIYSNKILDFAKAEGIVFTITKQLIAMNAKPTNYFEKLLTAINDLCKGDKTLRKSLTNIITGFLGKESTTKYKVKLNTDTKMVWNDFTREEFHNNATFMFREDDFYLYGYKQNVRRAELNIPMYIQILDWSNMRLYNMIKQSGGECLFRKTDCAVIRGGALTFGDKNGDYRVSDVPLNIGKMVPSQYRSAIVNFGLEWNHHNEITNSSQAVEVFNIIKEKKGVCVVSRAGTGKSYNCLEVEKLFKDTMPNPKVVKLAFTNKACLNIKGTTIHKFLKIDNDGKFSLTWLKSLANFNMLFIIDEAGMTPGFLWRRLVELKKSLPNAYFMLLGDYRQVPPVEENPINYFNHPAVHYLANSQRVEFTVRQRYDLDLWNFVEDVYERQHTDFSKVSTVGKRTPEQMAKTTNICYYNRTRVEINKLVNEYVAKTCESVFIPFVVDEEKKDQKFLQQDAFIYLGLPLIAHRNNTKKDKSGDVVNCVNNETFTVVELDEKNMTAQSVRLNDEGEEYNHTFTIPISKFHEFFLLNYCSTTHKQQGATIDNNIVIYDYKNMTKELQYTALTRAKKLTQISIHI